MSLITLALLSSLTAAPTVIDNVHLYVGDGTVLPKTRVMLDGSTIRALGKFKVPKNAKRIDGSGKILSPGLMESLSQLGLTEVSSVDNTNDYSMDGDITPAFRAIEGFNPHSTRIPAIREAGVTHAVISPGGGLIAGQAHLATMQSSLRALPSATRPLAIFGSFRPSAAESLGGSRGSMWLGLRQLFADVRYYDRNEARVARGESRDLMVGPMQLNALRPVLKKKIPLVIHVDRAADIKTALKFAEEQKIRIIIRGGAESWMVASELASKNIPVIIRPSHQRPSNFERLAARDDLATVLHAQRVPVILTAGGYFQESNRLRQEAGIAVANGLPHQVAIQSITQTPARAFGLSDLGVIAPGKTANLVLWSSDPLEIDSVAERVWIQGREQNLDTRQKKLARRYLQRLRSAQKVSEN
ncbi:MAG: amidohydrolase family protein [Myxococcota bacterium]|nr:amidohydrolase family protein [Myxococcota bacterium]